MLKSLIDGHTGGLKVKDVTGTSVTLQQLMPNLNPPSGDEVDSAAVWARFALRSVDLYGDDSAAIQLLTSNNKDYDTTKRTSMVEFLRILQNSKAFRQLCEVFTVPS